MSRRLLIVPLAISLLLPVACGSGNSGERAGEGFPGRNVARIVMIDKAKACDCTKRCIEKCSIALEAALADLKIPVERVHFDTEPEAASTYRSMKPFAVLPALYFLDASGNLVGMLQGQVTEEQVKEALQVVTTGP